MGYKIVMDGKEISSPEQAEEIKTGGADAYENLVKFIQQGELAESIKNASVRPLTDCKWAEPYEGFAPPTGSVKHIVTDVRIDVDDWLTIQATSHGSGSKQNAINGATESTAETVCTAIDEDDTATLSEIPMPVLEIYMDGTSNHAEGRSRGVGVYRSKQQYIPIRVAARVYR